jgi:small-conductance mechanosensitive channel
MDIIERNALTIIDIVISAPGISMLNNLPTSADLNQYHIPELFIKSLWFMFSFIWEDKRINRSVEEYVIHISTNNEHSLAIIVRAVLFQMITVLDNAAKIRWCLHQLFMVYMCGVNTNNEWCLRHRHDTWQVYYQQLNTLQIVRYDTSRDTSPEARDLLLWVYDGPSGHMF